MDCQTSCGAAYEPDMCYAWWDGWRCTTNCAARAAADASSPGATSECGSRHTCAHLDRDGREGRGVGWMARSCSKEVVNHLVLDGETHREAKTRWKGVPDNAKFCAHFYEEHRRGGSSAAHSAKRRHRGSAAPAQEVGMAECQKCEELRPTAYAQEGANMVPVNQTIKARAAKTTGLIW